LHLIAFIVVLFLIFKLVLIIIVVVILTLSALPVAAFPSAHGGISAYFLIGSDDLTIKIHCDLLPVGIEKWPISIDLRDKVLNLSLVQLLPGVFLKLLLDFAEVLLRDPAGTPVGTACQLNIF
jgi:hypothetical protein